MWQPWEPTSQPTKRMSVLKKLSLPPDRERANVYVFVFDLLPGGQEEQSGEVVKLFFSPGELTAQIINTTGLEFSDYRHRNDWGTWDFPLNNPALLEQLSEALKSVSTPVCNYRLYAGDKSVIIVRELIVEPEPKIPAWNRCYITGKAHDFTDEKFWSVKLSDPGYEPKYTIRICKTCHHPVVTEGL